jgi:hypothetical protein
VFLDDYKSVPCILIVVVLVLIYIFYEEKKIKIPAGNGGDLSFGTFIL